MLDRSTVIDITYSAYGSGRIDAGRFACDRVRCLFDVEPRVLEETRRNECFYVVPFASFARGVEMRRVDPGMGGAVDAPTLVPDGAGLLAIVPIESDEGPRLRWVALDERGQPTGAAGDAGLPGMPDGWRMAAPQALAHDGGATVAALAIPADGGRPRMALAPFDAAARAFGPAMLAGDPDPGLWTGPWPLARLDGRFLLLPSVGPTAAMAVGADGAISFDRLQEAPRVADALHAATPLAPFGRGYLAMAREFMAFPGGESFDLGGVAAYGPWPNGLRVAHRFVAFDQSLRMTGLSHPFVFDGLGREACGGLAVTGDRVALAWVRDGAECWTGSLPATEVERLLSGIEGGVLSGPFLEGPSAVAGGSPRVWAAAAHRRSVAAARAIAERPLGAAGNVQAGWLAALQPPPDAMDLRLSVLLPTRGRPQALKRSVGTLLDRALHPEAIEIVLGVDRDDGETLAALGGMPPQVRAVVVERRGYARLHEYMNLLAREASGYWTVMWNDDNLMETRHWDEVICREPDCIGALLSNHGALNVTPVIPRHWLAMLGHYSLQNHNDSWWIHVAKATGLGRTLEVEFRHDRADLTGNNDDATWREQVYLPDEFFSAPTQEAIASDCRRLQAWIAFEQALAGELAGAAAREGA
ncbi:MAG: hypothetical protein ACKOWF_03750 [Chloroflexota bacterium]